MPIVTLSSCKSRVICALCAAVVLLGSSVASAQSPARMNPQEQEALKIVNAWNAAWNMKDVQKVASYMSEDIEFGLPGRLFKGRAKFLEEWVNQNMSGITYEILSEYAAGDVNQTVVVQKRVDHVNMNGRKMDLSFAAYFRVKGDKIIEWLDVPIGNLPPPPPGANPRGGPPPAGAAPAR